LKNVEGIRVVRTRRESGIEIVRLGEDRWKGLCTEWVKKVGGRGSGPRAWALRRQFSKPGGGGTVCMGTMFWGEGCHRSVTMGDYGVTVGGWGVTVGGWGVTVGGWGVTVEGRFGCQSRRLECHSGSGSYSGRYHSGRDRRHG